jgi:hypothetical protein
MIICFPDSLTRSEDEGTVGLNAKPAGQPLIQSWRMTP